MIEIKCAINDHDAFDIIILNFIQGKFLHVTHNRKKNNSLEHIFYHFLLTDCF